MKFPKHQYVRSKKLMEAYREIPCQHCGIADGTVCGAHGWGFGRGKGIKADDNRCASLCHKCHTALDQGNVMNKAERLEMWSSAHRNTVRELVKRGLWPLDVTIPDIRRMQ